MAAPNEITCKQLLRLIGLPDSPVIVDICTDEDFADDPYLIPGSIKHPHNDLEGIIARLDQRSVIVSCQKGLKLSQGLMSRLRGRGIDAQYLQGGMYGWRDEPNAPRIPFAALPATNLWVTRHRPKIDRIACPWLIRRFIDTDAEFLFVSPDQVAGVADRFGATPFDIPDVELTHQGNNCTFDAILDRFDLRTDALNRMSDVIRAADTGRDDNPQAAGLLAMSVGLSRMHRDDHTQLDAAMPLYDALYRWARDGVAETHASLQDAP
ncbi:chromate resistance protein ChrB domain-containing protein [Octadecabacter ascidiaceicola]|uniref:Chromate resistance exported protein n=1 Tax=Octadecabacter ascidiaceicola TaxID=1655543 RepID=A0A238JM38_9RHOB|nr:chromate resistance protein ChrB domain-containing protein [Octadecabacter ascidiaceicola]SMX31711.1 Chromate resistance exported protein [Octadecabacter ascidiaceicola]